jgi:hypothetical protein
MPMTMADFRIIHTECCGSLLCWVNPRLPMYCPECGTRIYPEVKNWVTWRDDNAHITHKNQL